jgi:proteasome lid subunit RPN8/RPN11
MEVFLHRYIVEYFRTMCRLMDKEWRTRNKEFYLLLVSKVDRPNEVIDVKVPEQEVYDSYVRAKSSSIAALASELDEDEVFCGSLHRHPFANPAFLSTTDHDLMETMAKEMAPRRLQWISDREMLPTLRCHISEGGHLLVDGTEVPGAQIELSGAVLTGRPTSTVFAIVNADQRGTKFYGKALHLTFCQICRSPRERTEEIQVKVVPDDGRKIDEESVRKLIKNRIVTMGYHYTYYHKPGKSYSYGYGYTYSHQPSDRVDEISKRIDDLLRKLDRIDEEINELNRKLEKLKAR